MRNKYKTKIANRKLRFVNVTIDTTICLILLFPISLFTFYYFDISSEKIQLYSFLITFITFFSYYSIMEILFQKTVGKFITKTKVVKNFGLQKKPESNSILWRTFLRFIPFEAISFLFNKEGIHDYYAGTAVVTYTLNTEKKD